MKRTLRVQNISGGYRSCLANSGRSWRKQITVSSQLLWRKINKFYFFRITTA